MSIDESLYLNGKTARRISLGFNGLAADWYWMRSLQYVGKKIINAPGDVALDDLSLAQHEVACSVARHSNDTRSGVYRSIRVCSDRVACGRRAAKLFASRKKASTQIQMRGGSTITLATSTGNKADYQAAGEIYGRGAQIPGAPAWMEAMKAKMVAEGGSRSTAREIYTRMYEQSS